MGSPAVRLHMPTSIAFARAIVFHSIPRSSLRNARPRVSECAWHPHRTRRALHCSAAANANTSDDHTPQTSPHVSHPAQVPEHAPLKPPLETDALLAAFDEAIEAQLDAPSEPLSPSDIKSKRKAAKTAADAIRDQEYLRRLEVLTALPADIEIRAKSNQCPGCGCALQSVEPESPGYVPHSSKQEATPKAGREYFAEDDTPISADEVAQLVADSEAEKKPVICQRCYKLSHYGSIAETLRVKPVVAAANIEHPIVSHTGPVTSRGRSVLSAARFRKSLEALRNKSAVIVYLVDIFDFHGTFLTSLQDIIGNRNPILLAVNKIDLLPHDFKAARVEKWVLSECESLGLQQVAAVHMVSSTKGTGVGNLLADAVRTAKRRSCDIYVVGAANVGKSSFINKVVALRKSHSQKDKRTAQDGRGRRPKLRASALTTSVIPGTTLDSIRIPLGHNINLYDTPGVIVNHQLTNRLTADELRAVLPSKNVECVTYRLGEGKALYLGGLARIDVLEGKPFFFTVFISPDVKVHPGKIEGAAEFLAKHSGDMLTPPFSGERFSEMGEWTSKTFTATGDGWKRAGVDIVLSGLGWVAVTGPGSVKLRVNTPYGIGVFTREALMPFEARTGVSKYTGSRGLNRRQGKPGKNKRRSDSFSSIDDWN